MTEEADAVLVVKKRKVANVFKGEPWVYPNAVVKGPEEACLVRVLTEDEQFLGWADYNPIAPVRARILLRREVWPGDQLYLSVFLENAISRRLRLGMSVQGGAFRLVNSEGDGLPGLVIDQFGHTIVIDILSAGMLKRVNTIQSILKELLDDSEQVVRFGDDSAKREGCEPLPMNDTTVLRFAENGVYYEVPLSQTQKTGFFLDQRLNRRLVAQYAAERTVLDLFCYQGGFALSALAGGALDALAVDSSQPALDAALDHAERNTLDLGVYQSDVFEVFKILEQKYDMIICDPPKLAPRKSNKDKALNAYRHLIKGCLQSLNENGLLLICSCSQSIQNDDLREVVLQQANKMNMRFDVIAMTNQPPDHPWPLAFQTGRYLSSLLLELRSVS